MQNTKKAPNKGVRLLLIVFGGILAVILLAAAALFVIPLTERVDAAPVAGSADWMAMLPDDVPLGELSIPGTHDAGTQYVQLGFFSKCQARSVGQQLEDGFRYLDIRLAVNGDGLGLNHGFCECRTGAAPWSDRLMLEDVLEDCYAFLSAHPTETVIFAVKQEHGDESVAEFQRVLDRYIQEDAGRWYLDSELPSLGEARGRLVLLRRYDDEAGLGKNAGIALTWPNQNGYDDPARAFSSESCSVGSLTLAVQDRYEYDEEEKGRVLRRGGQSRRGGAAVPQHQGAYDVRAPVSLRQRTQSPAACALRKSGYILGVDGDRLWQCPACLGDL